MKEHFDDPYVKKAQQMGYRSRAAFKLQELQDKDKLVKSGSTVVDLGAAPGGWSQLAAKWVGDRGIVVASDILAMDSIVGVQFVHGDFTEQQAYDEILNIIGNKGADLVISDMAPNMSGMSVTDQSRAMYLAELALDLARQILAINGSYAIKLFQGEGFDDYLGLLRQDFNKVLIRKPSASRPRSREVYAVAKGFKGVSNR